METAPAGGDRDTARWRVADEYIDASKKPGDLITFREVQDLLGVDKATAVAVIRQARTQREKAGKPTLVAMRRAGWLLARPDQELEEDARRHEHLLNAAEGRVRLLGSLQGRRASLTDEQRRALDFRQAQAAAHATVLGSRTASALDILATIASQPLPIAANTTRDGGER